jgi:hypothetical protein
MQHAGKWLLLIVTFYELFVFYFVLSNDSVFSDADPTAGIYAPSVSVLLRDHSKMSLASYK